VVDCRTDGCAGCDEKDVGVRSCSCGVAEKKSAARMAHGDRGHNSREIRNLILFGMARYKSCARTRMVLSIAGIVQQQLNGTVQPMYCPARLGFEIPRYLRSYNTEAWSCRLCSRKLGAFQSDSRIWINASHAGCIPHCENK
jgi:hypothetical protein